MEIPCWEATVCNAAGAPLQRSKPPMHTECGTRQAAKERARALTHAAPFLAHLCVVVLCVWGGGARKGKRASGDRQSHFRPPLLPSGPAQAHPHPVGGPTHSHPLALPANKCFFRTNILPLLRPAAPARAETRRYAARQLSAAPALGPPQAQRRPALLYAQMLSYAMLEKIA